MNAPLVSLYIPTRERPQLLQRALESALSQDYHPVEILVAVDGPDAHTEALLARYASDSRVRIIARSAQGGACAARNDAIREAQGELITGLDDDDELTPNHVSILVDLLARSNAPFVAASNIILRREGETLRHAFTGPIRLEALLRENIVGNQVLTRTEYLRELGGFDRSMPAWQDYDLWVRLALRYGQGFKVDSRSYIQHQDHGETRISSPMRIALAHQRFIEKHGHLLGSKELASLELLVLATTHRPFGLRKLAYFVASGLRARALTTYVANRFPPLRSAFFRARRILPRIS